MCRLFLGLLCGLHLLWLLLCLLCGGLLWLCLCLLRLCLGLFLFFLFGFFRLLGLRLFGRLLLLGCRDLGLGLLLHLGLLGLFGLLDGLGNRSHRSGFLGLLLLFGLGRGYRLHLGLGAAATEVDFADGLSCRPLGDGHLFHFRRLGSLFLLLGLLGE